MDHKKLRPYFLMILLILAGILTFFIFKPFLFSLILAAVFAVVFQPLHKKILAWTNNRQVLAALLTTILIVVIILGPLILLGIQVFQEAQQLYVSLAYNNPDGTILTISNTISAELNRFFPGLGEFSIDVDQYVKQTLNWILSHNGDIISNITKLLASIFIFLVSLYYLLKDGEKIKKNIIALSPLADSDDETVFKRLEVAINSVIKGNLIVAIAQGLLATLGFMAFGVPNFVLWGTVTAVAALIPGIGTAIVILPAVAYLFFQGSTLSALWLLIWGLFVVGLIDNVIRPKIVEGGLKLHPLAVFLSVFGGFIFFGPIGFLLGPLSISLFFALLDLEIKHTH